MKLATFFLLTALIEISLRVLLPTPAPKPVKLVKVWETDTTLRTPNRYFTTGKTTLYVSNMGGNTDPADGDGFIAKVSLDGKIENLKWTTGLNAPKGMGLYKNKLYVDGHSPVSLHQYHQWAGRKNLGCRGNGSLPERRNR